MSTHEYADFTAEKLENLASRLGKASGALREVSEFIGQRDLAVLRAHSGKEIDRWIEKIETFYFAALEAMNDKISGRDREKEKAEKAAKAKVRTGNKRARKAS